MQKDEAKRTPITEFTNNVVHSNRVVSISIHCTVGQMLQRIIHRRLTIKKALIDYNVEWKRIDTEKSEFWDNFFYLWSYINEAFLNFFFFSLFSNTFKLDLKLISYEVNYINLIPYARDWYNLRTSTGFTMSSWNVMYFILRAGYSLTGAWGTTLDSLLEPNTPRSVTPRTRPLPHRPLYSTGLQVSYGLQLQHFPYFRLISEKCCLIFSPFVGWTRKNCHCLG